VEAGKLDDCGDCGEKKEEGRRKIAAARCPVGSGQVGLVLVG